LEWAKAASLRRVDLTVSTENAVAIHVFIKCGFEHAIIYDNKMLLTTYLS
jgi:RimJ/RimL family protein N-acetyltransferase